MITKYNECIGEICSYTHEMRFADLALDSSFFVFCNKKNPGKITVYKSETLAKIPYFFVVTLYLRRTVFVAINYAWYRLPLFSPNNSKHQQSTILEEGNVGFSFMSA